MDDFALLLRLQKPVKSLETYVGKIRGTYTTNKRELQKNPHLVVIHVTMDQFISLPSRIMSGEFKDANAIITYLSPASASASVPASASASASASAPASIPASAPASASASDRELEQRKRLFAKQEGLEDLPLLIPPNIFSFPVKWTDSKLRKGTVTLSNGVGLSGSWTMNNGIDRLEEVSNIQKITVTDIMRVIRPESIVNSDFYRLLDPEDPALFFEKLKIQSNVRIIATCHGCILEPFKSPCNMHRISSVPQGVCTFTTTQSRLNISLTTIVDDYEFKTESQDYLTMHLRDMRAAACKDKKHHDKMLEVCSELEFSPEKLISKGELMFDKKFSSNPGLSLLFIGFLENGKYKYKNLFLVKSKITLTAILNDFIPACTDCVLVDMSCSTPCKGFGVDQPALDRYGGTRTQKSKQKRRKCSRKIKN
jgi:hypothetical protein